MDSEKQEIAKRDQVEQKWWWGWAAAMSIISEAIEDKVAESKEQWSRQGWDAAMAATATAATVGAPKATIEETTAEVYFVDEEEKTAALEFEKGLMRERALPTQDPVEQAWFRGFKSGMSIAEEKIEENLEGHRQRCFRAGWGEAMAARAAAAAKATGDS